MLNLVANDKTTRVMRNLYSNPVAKLMAINVTTMVVPRITIASLRNKYAGQEAAFYELVGMFTNYALPGMAALSIAYSLDKLKNPMGVRSTGWAKTTYLDSFSQVYKNAVNEISQKSPQAADIRPDVLKRFIRNVLGNLETSLLTRDEPIKLNEQQLDRFTTEIQRIMGLSGKEAKQAKQALAKEMAQVFGSFDRLVLKGQQDTVIKADGLIQHINYLGKEFQKGHTSTIPAEISKNIENVVRKLHKSNIAKSFVGISLATGLSFSMQFINRWITKKRTGQDGFVGYSDFGQQPSATSHQASVQHHSSATPSAQPSQPATAYMPTASPAPYSASPSPQFSGMKMPNLQSSQFLPSVEQLKAMYGVGLAGRLLASRDLSEFRESLILSGFGYVNFLFLPNFVENLVAHSFRNNTIFNSMPNFKQEPTNTLEKLKQGFIKVNQSGVRSYQDIEAFASKLGEQLGDKSDTEIKEKLSPLLKRSNPTLEKLEGLNPQEKAQRITAAVAKELNGIKNMSHIAGITYACLTLGVGLNLLNMYITNKKRARQLAEQAKSQQAPAPSGPPAPLMSGLPAGSPAGANLANPFQTYKPA